MVRVARHATCIKREHNVNCMVFDVLADDICYQLLVPMLLHSISQVGAVDDLDAVSRYTDDSTGFNKFLAANFPKSIGITCTVKNILAKRR